MAVTVRDLACALRITSGSLPPGPIAKIMERLLGVADAFVQDHAPDAPESVRDQAVVQFAAYLYDQPTAEGGPRYASAFRNSGALALLARWIPKRAGVRAEVGEE